MSVKSLYCLFFDPLQDFWNDFTRFVSDLSVDVLSYASDSPIYSSELCPTFNSGSKLVLSYYASFTLSHIRPSLAMSCVKNGGERGGESVAPPLRGCAGVDVG
ncbi:hypothetical protein EVAR_9243_1 [Eumeta japonica]|uniref:Uncharacterized protein n=1 Tax=Eumeta variegata TaxID=151549 RepID=A0A4C1TMT5_EUMVA|nr:hypothetical protein EVAR_9243_1 [Eumeta japonica]